MNKIIAVTGASGHIGNVVCRLLLDQGYRVKALYHSDFRSLKGLNVESLCGDVLNKEDLAQKYLGNGGIQLIACLKSSGYHMLVKPIEGS